MSTTHRVANYRLYSAELSCLRPFRIATGLQQRCRTLLVEVQTEEGLRGLGEATPIPHLTDETFDGARQALSELLLPLLPGRTPWELADLHRQMWALTRSKSARCAVDLALYHLQEQIAGVPLSVLLGGAAQPSGRRFETNYSIGIEEPGTAAELALQYRERGYRAIKVKVGRSYDEDLEVLRAIQRVLAPDMVLRLDANCGWSRRTAVRILQRLEVEEFPIELVEQPTLREDLLGLRYVRERTRFPIAADESVQTLYDARALLVDDCVDILNLKLMKTGGLFPALEIASMARAHRVDLMVGGMVGESLLGVRAAAALAAARDFEYADLDADILLADTPFEECEPGGYPLRAEPPFRSWTQGPTPVLPLSGQVRLLVEG